MQFRWPLYPLTMQNVVAAVSNWNRPLKTSFFFLMLHSKIKMENFLPKTICTHNYGITKSFQFTLIE